MIVQNGIQINAMKVKSRLVLPPMATYQADENGFVTDLTCEAYDEKTRGGLLGLAIVEHSFVDKTGRAAPRQLSVAEDAAIDGLRCLADCLHTNGTKACLQLSHAGAYTACAVTGGELLSASAVAIHPQYTDVPREMTISDINKQVRRFIQAAVRAKEAGFDAVEVHSAHSYLLNQFLSPLSNKRSDEYGAQSIANRTRFHVRIVRGIREAVGEDYPILVRLGANDYLPNGGTAEDAAEASARLAEAGVDAIDVSGGLCRYILPDRDNAGYFRDTSLAVKKAVSIPVILTGGITTVAEAESLIAEGYADMIGIGRAILKNPNWAKEQAMNFFS